ncbi:hypothetical protein BDM02DRAFT_3189313 [Thelephora ganbajun]|uniref:Uncharacterized protein n=1 Tax=Thelephora ganbajun TaxID=370292 RepID=A0ACB6Z8G5_THEGA|nr:hypothetical protein BDM02DRAFT_3189313 [Thelephora ganbajun]
MGTTDSAVQSDSTGQDLEENLFQGLTEMSAKPKIYKLNVYSKVSFEALKDTPRDTGILRSLVIVYPAPHEGEGLSSPFLTYVAFYSVIEQEVLKVTTGSLTRNLHLVSHGSISQAPASSDPLTCLREASGFSLAYLYPVTSDARLQEMIAYLKGEDTHVYQSCRELELESVLRMKYSQCWS